MMPGKRPDDGSQKRKESFDELQKSLKIILAVGPDLSCGADGLELLMCSPPLCIHILGSQTALPDPA